MGARLRWGERRRPFSSFFASFLFLFFFFFFFFFFFPAAFSATVRLSDHFDSTDGRFLEDTSSRLWRLLCDGVASPLAAAAAASARLPPLEASLLGLPEDLLLEVLLTVAGGYEPPPEGGASKRKKEEEGEREEGGKGGQQQERERGGGGGGGSGYYACRLCRLAASGGQRGRGLASLGGLAYLWGQVPPLWPRSGRCRQEQDLVSVAGTCRALREFVLGEGSGGGGGGGARRPHRRRRRARLRRSSGTPSPPPSTRHRP